jgi:signal transduction histidine kinase
LEAKRRGAFTGNGLGLAFCKSAVEAHGGKIRIENKKNGGAKVTFTLPKMESI